MNLVGFNVDNELRFDKHISSICTKANKKLSALTRLSRYISLEK